MSGVNVIKRKNRKTIIQILILCLVFMVTVGGMLRSMAAVAANDLGLTTLIEPKVWKDVEGNVQEELIKGEDFNYNVNVALPDDLSDYESMKILDNLDERLAVQETSISING